MPATDTTPIPRPGQDSALGARTNCPRCGMPAEDRHSVAIHDLWHRGQDVEARRLAKVLDRLEGFLDSVENVLGEDGKPQKFPDWKAEVDDLIDALPDADHLAKLADLDPERLAQLTARAEEHPAAAVAAEPVPWPGDPYADPEDDTPLAARDADRALASVPDLADALAGEPEEDAVPEDDDRFPPSLRTW